MDQRQGQLGPKDRLSKSERVNKPINGMRTAHECMKQKRWRGIAWTIWQNYELVCADA